MATVACLRAAVSRARQRNALKGNDDEEIIEILAERLSRAWGEVVFAMLKSFKVWVAGEEGRETDLRISEGAQHICDDFAYFALRGYLFYIEYPCGTKKKLDRM